MQSHLLPWFAGALLLSAAACSSSEPLFDAGSAGPRDAQPGLDGGQPDAAPLDGGQSDASGDDASVPDAGPIACGFETLGPANAPKIMLLSHPFTEQVEVPGTEISSRTLQSDLQILDNGLRLDVGTRVSKLAFVPSGALAFALGEDGTLVSVRVGGVNDLEVLDRLTLPSATYGDLRVLEDGQTLLIAGANGNPAAGLSTVHVGCDGSLELDQDLFFTLALADAFALSPDGRYVWVSGGQTLFEPIDHDDVRVLERLPTGGYAEGGAFDIFTDFMSADSVALSPDGRTLLVPNGLDFSNEANHLAILGVQDATLTSVDRITMNLPDLAHTLFSVDGATIVATLAEPGQVVALSEVSGSWQETSRLRGIGLADQVAHVTRGDLSDYIFVPSTDPNGGPNVAIVRIMSTGQLAELPQHELGPGFDALPRAIAITP